MITASNSGNNDDSADDVIVRLAKHNINANARCLGRRACKAPWNKTASKQLFHFLVPSYSSIALNSIAT